MVYVRMLGLSTGNSLERMGVSYLGEEIDTNGCLIHVVERVVHESGNQRRLAHCAVNSVSQIDRVVWSRTRDTYRFVPLRRPA